LKREYAYWRLADAVCFQPTYEELKLPLQQAPCASPPCFQPTYEELKQHEKHLGAHRLRVSSLPTRN